MPKSKCPFNVGEEGRKQVGNSKLWSCTGIYRGTLSHLTLYGDTGGGGVFFLVGVFLGEAGGEGSWLAGLSNTITWFVSADSITTMGFALDPSTGAKGLGGLLSCC